jgi:hypothetical protein
MRQSLRCAALLVLVVARPAAALAQMPAGGEFQVNTFTTGIQGNPRAAVAGDGSFWVVWTSVGPQPPVNIVARKYGAEGIAQSGELPVAAFNVGELGDVAAGRAGNFVVAWQVEPVQTLEEIHLRRFSATGLPLGNEAVVSPPRSRFADVGMGPAGDFVAVWEFHRGGYLARDIFARRMAADGTPLGAAFLANTYTFSDQRGAEVAVDGAGRFTVVWRSRFQDYGGYGLFGQRFDAAGLPLGTEFRVNSYTTGTQLGADIAAAADGRFVVAWSGDGDDASAGGVFAQRFGAEGTPRGAEFRVNTYTTGSQFLPRVAADAAGNFVVAWSSPGQDGSSDGVFAQRFTAAGTPRGAEFRVNSATTDRQVVSAVASDGEGNFVIAWSSGGGQDGSDYGVFGQRFGGLVPAGLAVDTAGNGVFEPGEVVDVVPSWRNVNGVAQTIGGTAVSFTGPQPAVYQVNTPFANYTTIPNGATRPCLDCYRVAVPTTARPVLHWDAVFDERLTPDTQGQEKLWRVHLGASFTDTPTSSLFYGFVETLLHHGVTAGCGAGTYCPGSSAARQEMAVFVLVAKEGPGYQPPACTTPVFGDVPASSPFCPFIEDLFRRGVTGGCGGGNYCPAAAVPREQMPVFVLRTLDPTLDPPACTTPMFTDVPASNPFCRWIEELARRGVVGGCGGGNYCPADPVTREQMAVFIAGAFALTPYGP